MDCKKHKGQECRLGTNNCDWGAAPSEKGAYFIFITQADWEGQLIFDQKLYKNILNLPIDYHRINQFPEWFTLDPKDEYHITASQKNLSGNYSIEKLMERMAVKLSA